MMIIGCDFHPSWQQVSWLDTETAETGEQKLVQASGDAERFYPQVAAPALIGMEATGNCHWLVDLLAELGHELWVGDAAQIRASYVRQQKTDKRDAAHILKLLVEGRFPRIWMPSSEVRDRRQLLLHRYKLVIMRARVKNELQHLCLWSAAEAQAVEPSRTADLARTTAAAVGGTSARRLAKADGDARPADRTARPGGKSRSSARQNGAASSNPTRSRSDHGAGLRADPERCQPLPARQAGGQLPGPDSARALLGRTAEAGGDHQAGQPHAAHVAGGSGAGGGGARSRIAQAVSPPLSSETQSRGQSGRGPQISRTTLLDAARTWPIQRSFASRAARGCPWSAQARPQVLIGRFRIP